MNNSTVGRKVSLVTNLDWWTILLYLILIFLGWINIYAAVYNEDHTSILDISQRYGKQLMWIGASILLAICILLIDAKFFSTFAYPIYISFIVLLIAVLFLGKEINGARSWFQLGAIRFQPAEFAKFATCLAISRYVTQFNFKIHELKSLITTGTILFLPAFLIILERDAGSALVYASFILVLYRQGLSGYILFIGIWMVVLFIATLLVDQNILIFLILGLAAILVKISGVNLKSLSIGLFLILLVSISVHFVGIIAKKDFSVLTCIVSSFFINLIPFVVFTYRKKLLAAAAIIFLFISSVFYTIFVDYVFQNVLESHQRDRIEDLLGKKSDPYGTGYNVAQSKIAIGSGGFAGKGFLNGTQTKFKFVPEQSTDFIFCTVGEEWGFLGSVVVIILLVTLMSRIVILAERQRTSFSRVYGYGVACILFFHMSINIGMTIGLVPVIGIPLPFFSYGGSSLWSFTILLFIFLKLDANRMELLR
ncbi:MAG: rod shape-determining protein RodA [Marinifilaceae bacterium]|jgi:rod shape determining protein RodA|nr:rod shape-determining protein RodA [Marinifilaceae bacterium]